MKKIDLFLLQKNQRKTDNIESQGSGQNNRMPNTSHFWKGIERYSITVRDGKGIRKCRSSLKREISGSVGFITKKCSNKIKIFQRFCSICWNLFQTFFNKFKNKNKRTVALVKRKLEKKCHLVLFSRYIIKRIRDWIQQDSLILKIISKKKYRYYIILVVVLFHFPKVIWVFRKQILMQTRKHRNDQQRMIGFSVIGSSLNT